MRVAIVEDEYLIASHLEFIVEELGYESAGIAIDTEQAARLIERRPDVVFVDLNLRDGPTGLKIANAFGEVGTAVVFLTGNTNDISPPVLGAVGKLAKPCGDDCIASVLTYVRAKHSGQILEPPRSLMPL